LVFFNIHNEKMFNATLDLELRTAGIVKDLIGWISTQKPILIIATETRSDKVPQISQSISWGK